MLDKIKQKLSNASDNDKIVYRNVIGAFIVKGGALFISLFTLPAYINFFNNDVVLGVWYTILSLLNCSTESLATLVFTKLPWRML